MFITEMNKYKVKCLTSTFRLTTIDDVVWKHARGLLVSYGNTIWERELRTRKYKVCCFGKTHIARLMGPTWGQSGADMAHVGPMLAPLTLLSGEFII